ncbi:outer membrane protein assembly factor BamC [Colwellia ponticola]|uniref:Outer membrane protein assembly factor BamC n=1 Tax=Colwellia ponticola TaxID=2304625 RepID=A0A8H2JL11_9GAMM|nr:outer membrane protein assembly factor BamC [Colwellia ponticola]TMM44776.1 outer membrane protein assembly factor BamC [Colwellia ponticola]
MSCRAFYLSLLALSLTACSAGNNKQAQGSFDYQYKPETNDLVIPENLNKPKQANDFFITDKINNQGPVGEDMDIRAPSLVMPIAASSRVVNESNIAIIWFDKVLEDKELLPFIENVVKAQLVEDNVSYHYIEEDIETTLSKVTEGTTSLKDTTIKRAGIKTAIIESDWYHNEVDAGWIFTEIQSSKSLRFRYQLLAKAHGRSVSLRVSLVDFLQTDEKGGSKTMDPIDKQRAEKAMLNELIAAVDYNYRVQQRADRLKRANQQLVTIGKNTAEEEAYIIEMGLDSLWSNMPLFFEKHGFTITDLNEDKKIYYVEFVKPEISMWDSIWGDNVPVIDVSDAHYQFVLAPVDDTTTSVSIYNADGEPLTFETLERIFPVVEKGLSFRDIF